MVVGGDPINAHYQADFIDLSGSGRACPDVTFIPELEYGSVGTFIAEAPLVCGGFEDKCYSYDILVLPSFPKFGRK